MPCQRGTLSLLSSARDMENRATVTKAKTIVEKSIFEGSQESRIETRAVTRRLFESAKFSNDKIKQEAKAECKTGHRASLTENFERRQRPAAERKGLRQGVAVNEVLGLCSACSQLRDGNARKTVNSDVVVDGLMPVGLVLQVLCECATPLCLPVSVM